MSEEIPNHCRLCAEPTEMDLLLDVDSEDGLKSKLTQKLSWINVNVNNSNSLPKTICFSCFDSLERTWKFLQNVKVAQKKLWDIYEKGPPGFEIKPVYEIALNKKSPGRPNSTELDDDDEAKTQVKSENTGVKIELSDSDYNNESDCNFSKPKRSRRQKKLKNEDDIPISEMKRKNKKKKKTKKEQKANIKTERESYFSENEIADSSIDIIPLDMSIYKMTWTNYTWICGHCDTNFSDLELLRNHSMELHEACVKFKCYDCFKQLTRFKVFLNHVRTHYKALRYCCELCNEHIENHELLKAHTAERHSSVLSSMCRSCGIYIEDKNALKEHIQTYSKSLIKRKSEKSDIGLCKDYECFQCMKKFKTKSNLTSHMALHSERKREFSCHVCGKMFFTKGTLTTHMLTHDDTKPFKCGYCDLSFRVAGNLRSHISMHSGVKPFICEQCGKRFRVKRHLKSHLIVHTDLMPYQCSYCSKTFRFKTRLNLHVRQHTGAKPYLCDICKRQFTNGSNYKKHMMRRHNMDVGKRKYNLIVPQLTEYTQNVAADGICMLKIEETQIGA